MAELSKDLKEGANLVPYFAGYFVLYGVIDATAYYSSFNINIFYFISFSEIIFYFLNDIYNIALVVIMTLLVYAIGLLPIEKKMKESDLIVKGVHDDRKKVLEILNDLTGKEVVEGESKLAEAEHLISRIKRGANKSRKIVYLFITALAFLLTILVIAIVQLAELPGWNSLMIFSLPFGVSILVLYFIRNLRTYLLITLILQLVLSAYFTSAEDARRLKKKGNSGYTLLVEDQVLVSDSVNYFIGKTENYIFFYKSHEKTTTAYRAENLKYLVIPDKSRDTP